MWTVGIDLGGTIVKIGLIQDGSVKKTVQIRAHADRGMTQNLAEIKQEVEALLESTGIGADQIQGVGLAFPGIVDNRNKVVLSTNKKYTGAEEFDFTAWADESFGCHIEIDNDARLALLGEANFGAGIGSRDIVMMTFGTGIGGAALIDGQLLRGRHHQAGCLGGHFIVKMGGRTCSCGGRGCAEAEAASWQLPNMLKEDPRFTSSELADLPLTFASLFKQAELGDELALDIRNRIMDVWSSCIVNMIHAYDPEKIILGGGVMKSAEVILPYVTNEVQRLAWTPWGFPEITAASLGDSAALLGCHSVISQNRIS